MHLRFNVSNATNQHSCREGRSRPNANGRKNEKGNQILNNGDASRQKSTVQNSSQQQLSGLERLHCQTDIRSSLKMKQARLTPGLIEHGGLKRKTKETFQIQFTEVELRHTIPCNAINDNLDEDLPSVEDLLCGGKSASCDKDAVSPDHSSESESGEVYYSGPDMDLPRKRSRIHSTHNKVCKFNVNSTCLGGTDHEQPLSLLPDNHNREVSSRTPVPKIVDSSTSDARRPATQPAYESVNFSVQGSSVLGTEPLSVVSDREHHVAEEDEFAELDEWLRSGFVETD